MHSTGVRGRGQCIVSPQRRRAVILEPHAALHLEGANARGREARPQRTLCELWRAAHAITCAFTSLSSSNSASSRSRAASSLTMMA